MTRRRGLDRRVSRRDMLLGIAGLGGVAAATQLLDSCRPGGSRPVGAPLYTPTPTPTEAAKGGVSRVAFVKTTDRAQGVREALRLLSPNSVQGKQLLLKPNLNSDDPPPGSTHPATLRTLAEWLQQEGAAHIIVGDRSGISRTRPVMEATGVIALAQDLDLEVMPFDELNEADWEPCRPDGSHWNGDLPVPRVLSAVDAIVQTCNLKTHGYGGHFTLSLKNSVGIVPRVLPGHQYNYMSELHSSPYQREMIAEINTAYSPDLIVLDAVEAFTAGGPAEGTKVATGAVLAGTDRIALDAVGVALLRYWGTTPQVSKGPIFQQAQIARAVELGLGITSVDQIEIVTDDEPSRAYATQVRAVLDGG